MTKQKFYSFQDHLQESLQDPEFKKAWAESEPEYLLAKELIEKRLAQKMSQRFLAKKLQTTQAVISRIETLQANPSLNFLKRLAKVFNTRLEIKFQPI